MSTESICGYETRPVDRQPTVAPPHVPLHDAHCLHGPTKPQDARRLRPASLAGLLALTLEEGHGLRADHEGRGWSNGKSGGVLVQFPRHALQCLLGLAERPAAEGPAHAGPWGKRRRCRAPGHRTLVRRRSALVAAADAGPWRREARQPAAQHDGGGPRTLRSRGGVVVVCSSMVDDPPHRRRRIEPVARSCLPVTEEGVWWWTAVNQRQPSGAAAHRWVGKPEGEAAAWVRRSPSSPTRHFNQKRGCRNPTAGALRRLARALLLTHGPATGEINSGVPMAALVRLSLGFVSSLQTVAAQTAVAWAAAAQWPSRTSREPGTTSKQAMQPQGKEKQTQGHHERK